MPTLHEILWDLRNEDLAYRLKLLKVKPRNPRKADLIDALKEALSREGLETLWKTLDDLDQAAVAEACYSPPDYAYHEARIQAKHGSSPKFHKPPEDRYSSWSQRTDSKYATHLNLLFYYCKDGRERVVPSDIADRLRRFVPKPLELRVATMEAPVEEEGLRVRQTEHEALADVMGLLRLADQGKLRISAKTGKVSAAARRTILEYLSGGDFYPTEVAHPPNKHRHDQEIGAIKPIAWARVLSNARYSTASGSRSKLTPSGIKALSLPPYQLVERLWKKWLANTDYDEFNRIDDIKGQKSKGHMTAKPPRRSAIAAALSECPANKWISTEAFSKFMQGADYTFEVTRDPWKLYIAEARYGSLGYDGYGGWNIIQFRYLLCLLFEYAATLGLIDIAYVHPADGLDDYREQWGSGDLQWLSRYDGLRAFRITNLGAFCLGMTSGFKPTRPSSSLALTVLSSLRIQLQSGEPLPAEKLQLETWAEPVDPRNWQLDANRALEAVERGQSAADFADFLQRCDSQPLPETVQAFLKRIESDGKAVRRSGEAQLFECRDVATANVVRAQESLHGLCHSCGERMLAVPIDQLPKFRKVVRSLGLGLD